MGLVYCEEVAVFRECDLKRHYATKPAEKYKNLSEQGVGEKPELKKQQGLPLLF